MLTEDEIGVQQFSCYKQGKELKNDCETILSNSSYLSDKTTVNPYYFLYLNGQAIRKEQEGKQEITIFPKFE